MGRWMTLVLLLLSGLLAASGCGRSRRSRPRAKPRPHDAAVKGRAPDGWAPAGPRRPRALQSLLTQVPRRATWFLGLGRPAALLTGSARYWRMLAQIPDLSAPMARMATRLARVLGAWPPPASLWSTVGIDPGGAVVLAGVPKAAAGAVGLLALAFTSSPDKLLRRLVGPAGASVGSTARARLGGSDSWWCGRIPVGVACASSRALVTECVTLGRRPAAPTLGSRLAGGDWREVDLAAGWRTPGAGSLSTAVARFRSWGLEAVVRLHGGAVARWLDWLAPAGVAPTPAADAVAEVWLRLDPTRINTLVGLLPTGAVQSSASGAAAPATLLKQCTGEARLLVGAGGWSLQAQRRGSAVGNQAVAWRVSGWPLWARAPDQRLVLAGTEAGTRGLRVSAPVVIPRPLRKLGSRRASARVRIPLMDPLEALSAADRVRMVAALVGLPDGERAFVGLLRGLLTLLGVVGLSVEKAPQGALLRLAFVSPAAPAAPGRQAFERLWRAKWQGGGFFDHQALTRLALRHPKWVLGQVARGLADLRLTPAGSRWVTDRLLGLLGDLSGPELSCAALSARLGHCAEPFARLRAPRRWLEMESVVLPDHRQRLRRALFAGARREAEALGAHCDRLAGRLENAAAVKRCLTADGCLKFARCVVQAFTPK